MGNDGIVLSGKFSKALLDKNVKVWVAQGVAKLASEQPYYKMLAQHNFTDEELFSVMDGVERGELQEVVENGRYPEETDLPGFSTTYNVKQFGLIKTISKIAGRQDASRHKQKSDSKLAKSLGSGYIRALNRSVLDVVRNGFDTSKTSYGDAKPFFSTIHTRIDGGSTTYRSNASSTGLVLNYENLKTLKRTMRRAVDHSGEVIDYNENGIRLIVPTALVDAAYEAVGINDFAPDTSNFTPRRHHDIKEILVVPGLGAESPSGTGSDTAFYLQVMGLGDEEPIQVYHRQGLDTESQRDFHTKKFEVSADAGWAIGWTDPVGKFFGTKGDGLAYSS